MNGKKVYITTAIDYINAKPHLGHAVEKIQADVLARWYKEFQGNDVYFLSGSDENSLKNVQAAKKAGKPVNDFVDEYVKYFTDLKEKLNLSYDTFIRTTEDRHIKGAQKFWSLFKKEDIYKKNYKGLYCVGCEEFKRESDLVDGKCPEHNEPLECIEEENYFFKLSNYQEKLKKIIENDEVEVMPDYRKNEVLSFIKGGLEDFSISRSKKRAQGWGVPVPGDSEQVMYVWVDALSNYITGLDFASDGDLYKKYWVEGNEKIQIIGKGILRFHAVYWLAMLLSAGLPLPTKIISHEYLTVNNKKMSKSEGNIIGPDELVEKFGTDGTRYLLLSALPYSKDGDISWDKMTEKYNADLSNGLGNLVQRTLSMINQYGIKIEKRQTYFDLKEDVESEALPTAKIIEDSYMPEAKFDMVLDEIWKLIKESNIFIDEKKPWVLAKEKNHTELTRVLSAVYDQIYKIAELLSPFMPETSGKIRKQLEELKPEAIFPRLGN